MGNKQASSMVTHPSTGRSKSQSRQPSRTAPSNPQHSRCSGPGCLFPSLSRRRRSTGSTGQAAQPASPCSSRSSSPGSPVLAQRNSFRNMRRTNPYLGSGGGGVLHWNSDDEYTSCRHSFADDAPLEREEAPPQPEEETLGTGPLRLTTRLEYTSLQKGEAYNVFALVSLQADEAKPKHIVSLDDDVPPAPSASDRAPLDVVCVLDVSASMMGAKVELVKEAVKFVINEMLPGDRLSIVSFNHAAQRHTPLSRMDGSGKDAAHQANLRLTANGGTSIAAGLDCGIQVMEQRRQRNAVGAVFLLTDGQDGTTPAQIQKLVDRARAANCGVYAFGFGQDHDTSTLSAIAEAAHTPFTYVETPETITQAFAGTVGGLMSVAAQSIELTIKPEGGCTIASLHTHFANKRLPPSEADAVVFIPDAFAGERRDVVVELRVPAAAADSADSTTPLLRTSAKYRAVNERALVQMPEVCLYAERTSEPEGEPDLEVTTQRQRIEVTNALEKAISQGERGEFVEAQQMLDKNIEKLRSSRAQNEVSKALLSELNDARGRLSSAKDWSDGACAELTDAMWMHRHQRCTNITVTASSRVKKSSKALYLNHTQRCSIERCA